MEIILLSIIALLFLLNFILFVVVLIKQFSKGGAIRGILGIITGGIYTFIWGWIKHRQLEMTKTMVTWTATILIPAILPFVLVFTGLFSLNEFRKTIPVLQTAPPPRIVQKKVKRPPVKRTEKPTPQKQVQSTPPKIATSVQTPTKGAEPKKAIFHDEGLEVDVALAMKNVAGLLQVNDKRPDAYFNRGWLNAYQGKLEAAIEDYSQALQLNKKNGDAYYNRGLVFARLGRYEEAAGDFSEALKLNAHTPDALCNRGSAYFQLGKTALALKDYTTALKANPDDGDLLYNRATVYLALGDRIKAETDLKRAAGIMHEKTLKNFPALAPAELGSRLRNAAAACSVTPFLPFTSAETGERIRKFEDIRLRVEKHLDEFEKTAKQLLGDKVIRTQNLLQFLIQGKDPRWKDLFGSQWAEMIRQQPNEPRYFMIQVVFGWQEECRVLERFAACLEDPASCMDDIIADSALRIEKQSGALRLVDAKSPLEWGKAYRFGEGMIEIIQWAMAYLKEKNNRMPYEDMMLSLAREYTQRLAALMRSVEAATG